MATECPIVKLEVMLEIVNVPLSKTLTPQLRSYAAGVRSGFLEPPHSDEGVQRWYDKTLLDAARLRAVYDPERGFGLADEPIATFTSWSATINTGTGLYPIDLISDVTVQASHRRQGLMRSLMTRDLRDAKDRGELFATLTAADALLYGRFGFGVATTERTLEVETDSRFSMARPSNGTVVFAKPSEITELRKELFEQFHAESFFSIERPSYYWQADFEFQQSKPRDDRAIVHLDGQGNPDGAAVFTNTTTEVTIHDLLSRDTGAELEMLQFLAQLEGPTKLIWKHCYDPRHPLPWALSDRRLVHTTQEADGVWARIVDVAGALEARSFEHDGEVAFEVVDPIDDQSGNYQLRVTGGVAEVKPATGSPKVQVQLAALASLYSAIQGANELAVTGVISGPADEVAALDRIFARSKPGVCAVKF